MLHVHFLPGLVESEQLTDGVVVVIDVLRASTTIIHALEAGAREVIPCLEIEDARQRAASFAPSETVLGGERGGLPIEGFHLGNSPIEYTRRRVEGKTVVFTTTNGTRAMLHCRHAAQVYIGAFVNFQAVADLLHDSAENRHLLCAGTETEITREDVLFAGLVIENLLHRGTPETWLNDQARIARESAVATFGPGPARPTHAAIAAALKNCQGGRNLRALGLEGDIDTAAHIDRYKLVPRLGVEEWRIVANAQPPAPLPDELAHEP